MMNFLTKIFDVWFCRFSLSWWAYTFPMTGAAIATIKYSNEVTNVFTKAMCVILSLISTLTVTALLVTTILRVFVFKDLFPNDIAIAISDRKRKPHRKWFHLRHGSHDSKEIENYLKFVHTDKIDVEASTTLRPSNGSEDSPSIWGYLCSIWYWVLEKNNKIMSMWPDIIFSSQTCEEHNYEFWLFRWPCMVEYMKVCSGRAYFCRKSSHPYIL